MHDPWLPFFRRRDSPPVGDAEPLDLTTFDAAGFARIRVLGIETDALVDPGDPLAFPTGLTFLSAGQIELTMTPITAVPAPTEQLANADKRPHDLDVHLDGLRTAQYARQHRQALLGEGIGWGAASTMASGRENRRLWS